MKPKIFTYTSYRLPNINDINEINSANLSAQELFNGFSYTIIGRRIADSQCKNQIIEAIELMIKSNPTNQEYLKALDMAKNMRSKYIHENKNTIKGGKADKMSVEDIAKKFNVSVKKIEAQLKKGVKIEMEHTKDKEKATEIAMDHLSEFPDYYDRIEKMEKEAKKEWTINENKTLIKFLLRENINNRYNYLAWKRKNVTIRGISDTPNEQGFNGGGAVFGDGLYTAFLSNRALARKYGKVFFVVNAIPKNAKVVKTFNDAEIVIQTLIMNWCKKRGLNYQPNSFYKETDIRNEMISLGYDGLIIKGREMVNYTPSNILYFSNEDQLYRYFLSQQN